jgi:hypothetical protein
MLLALVSCAKSPNGEGEVTVMETPLGMAIVETWRMTATVSAIDPAKRKMTLTSPDGAKTTVKADQGVNVDQFKVGDRVSAEVTEELAVFLRKTGAPPSAGEGAAVGLATAGATRAMWMAETMEVTARVTNVDTKHRKVTLQLPDGKSKTVKVGKKVNLANVQAGDDVTVQVTEAIAVDVDRE